MSLIFPVNLSFIKVKAGNGGNGIISFRREKHVAKGGPNGGDGGDGGDIIAEVDNNLSTLKDIKYRKSYKAGRGAHGSGSNKTGKNGEPAILKVPPGTIIKDKLTGKIIADLTKTNEQVVIAAGGKGGRGNELFCHQFAVFGHSPRSDDSQRIGIIFCYLPFDKIKWRRIIDRFQPVRIIIRPV